MPSNIIGEFNTGIHNAQPASAITKNAAQDALNWITQNGHIQLANGRQLVGAEGVAGDCKAIWFGYKVDGTRVFWRKVDTKIQYLNGSVWTDVITGLNASDIFFFQNYSSLSGSFTFATGPGGIFKMNNASPDSYIDLYDSTKNFKGYGLIDKARMLMWGVLSDLTGLYGSYIDAQNSTVYTTVTSEVLGTGDGNQKTFTGTLAFKGSNPKANMFALTISAGAISGKDNYLGVISGSGVTGTINYTTGAYSITFTTAPGIGVSITGTYQWENSNAKGITDFTKSTTRLAGEGFTLRQDEGGDKIMRVMLGIDGNYYSLKQFSAYRYAPDDTDTKPLNEVFRKDIGISTMYGAASTGRGIIFLNTSSPEKPRLTILERNPLGDNTQVTELVPHFDFSKFVVDDLVMETYGRFTVMAVKAEQSGVNNRIILIDINAGPNASGVVDIGGYEAKCLTKDQGVLYCGSPLTGSVFKLFYGYDDEGDIIDNFYITKDDNCGIANLKKTRRLRLRGQISISQWYEIYAAYDNSDFSLVGTVRGDGGEVDSSNPGTIGNSLVGELQVGGENDQEEIYQYYKEVKIKCPKYGERTLKFIAKGLGYVDIDYVEDWDLMTFEQRIPKKYRQKQNVSLDGKTTNLPIPEF